MGGNKSRYQVTVWENDQLLVENASEQQFADMRMKKAATQPNLQTQFKINPYLQSGDNTLLKFPPCILENTVLLEIEISNRSTGIPLLSAILQKKFLNAKTLKIKVSNHEIMPQYQLRTAGTIRRSNSYSTDVNQPTPLNNYNMFDSVNNLHEQMPLQYPGFRQSQQHLALLSEIVLEVNGNFQDDGAIKIFLNAYRLQIEKTVFISYNNDFCKHTLNTWSVLTELKDVYIELKPADKQSMKSIIGILNKNSNLERISLKFASTNMNDEETIHFFANLNAFESLQYIDIDMHNNNFLSQGLISINQWVKKNISLASFAICLTNNTLIPFALKDLGQTLNGLEKLQTIKIITGEDIENSVLSLAQELKKIKTKKGCSIKFQVSRRLQQKVDNSLM